MPHRADRPTKACPVCGPPFQRRQTWKGIWDETHEFTDGSKIKVDLNYIRQSVYEPAAHVRVGYANQMPSYQGKLTEREVRAIATYITSLTDAFRAQAEQAAAAELEARKAGAAPAPSGAGTPTPPPATPTGSTGSGSTGGH